MLRNIEERISRLDEIVIPEGEINLTRLIQQQKIFICSILKDGKLKKNVLALETKIYALKNLPQPVQNPLELIDFTAKAKTLQTLLKDLEQTPFNKKFCNRVKPIHRNAWEMYGGA